MFPIKSLEDSAGGRVENTDFIISTATSHYYCQYECPITILEEFEAATIQEGKWRVMMTILQHKKDILFYLTIARCQIETR